MSSTGSRDRSWSLDLVTWFTAENLLDPRNHPTCSKVKSVQITGQALPGGTLHRQFRFFTQQKRISVVKTNRYAAGVAGLDLTTLPDGIANRKRLPAIRILCLNLHIPGNKTYYPSYGNACQQIDGNFQGLARKNKICIGETIFTGDFGPVAEIVKILAAYFNQSIAVGYGQLDMRFITGATIRC